MKKNQGLLGSLIKCIDFFLCDFEIVDFFVGHLPSQSFFLIFDKCKDEYCLLKCLWAWHYESFVAWFELDVRTWSGKHEINFQRFFDMHTFSWFQSVFVDSAHILFQMFTCAGWIYDNDIF